MNLQPGSRPVPNYPDYILIRKLGAGAFGEVWHAHGPGGLDVALKFIRVDAHGLARELRSLEAVKSIRHPNLVSLFGVWHKDNWLILAMELCDHTLEDRLAEALCQNQPGIPPDELLIYMSDAASGLDALSAKQVLHRDVKPANLLLLNSGVKVADYGLAKVLEQTVASNSGAGTIAYLAPECFKGKLTQHSDQYSLAVTYYRLRTGHLLFRGDQAQLMYAHLEAEPDLSHLPPAEATVLARALSKEPGKRWASCKTFVSGLIKAHQRAKEEERQRQEAERGRQEQERQKRNAEAAERKRQEEDARKKAVEGDFQTLLDEGKETGYLTYRQVSDYLSVRVFRIEPDGPVKVLPDNAVNREKFKQLLVVLEEQDIDVLDETEAIAFDPDNALVYYSAGNALFDRGDYDTAIRCYEEARWKDLEMGKKCYEKAMKELDDALKNIDEGVRFGPCAINNFNEDIRAPLYYNRGRLWLVKKDYDKAITELDEAIRLDPEHAEAYDSIAWLLATCPEEKVRDGKRAIQMATKACELADWKSGWELNSLAAAYAEAGQFEEAVRYQTKALEYPTCPGSAGDESRQRLELYKHRKPFRENI